MPITNFSLEKPFSWKEHLYKEQTNKCVFLQKKCIKEYFQKITEKGIISNKTFLIFFQDFFDK